MSFWSFIASSFFFSISFCIWFINLMASENDFVIRLMGSSTGSFFFFSNNIENNIPIEAAMPK